MALQDAALESFDDAMCSMDAGAVFEGAAPEMLPLLEKTIVKLDRKAKKKKAYKLSILQVAKEDDNKDYRKLETLWKMEKFLFRKLEKRYASKARARARQVGKKTPGTTKPLVKAKNVLTRSERETQKALKGGTAAIKPPSKMKAEVNSITNKLASKMK
jgi:hypothetical protein